MQQDHAFKIQSFEIVSYKQNDFYAEVYMKSTGRKAVQVRTRRRQPKTFAENPLCADLSSEFDKRLGSAIFDRRSKAAMMRADLGHLINMREAALRNCEFGRKPLTVAHLLRICAATNTSPLEILASVAPQFFGQTEGGASQVLEITKIVSKLDPDAIASIYGVVKFYSSS